MAELPFDWQQRIQKQAGPTTMALAGEEPAFVETRDPRYLSDAYQYYMQGMDRAATPSGITAATAAPVVQDPTTMIPQTGGGAGITGASVVQPTVSDPFLASGAAGGARLPTIDQAGAVAAMTQDPAYSLPGQSDPFLASGAAGGARLPTTPPIQGASGDLYAPGDLSILEKEDNYQDPNFIERLQNTFNTEGLSGVVANFGQSVADKLTTLKNQGIDVGRMAVGALMSAIQPGAGILAQAIPEDTAEDAWFRTHATVEGMGGDPYGYYGELQHGNINQDPFGRNPVSALGNYKETLQKDAQYEGDNQFNLDKKDFAIKTLTNMSDVKNPNEMSILDDPQYDDMAVMEGLLAAEADKEDDMIDKPIGPLPLEKPKPIDHLGYPYFSLEQPGITEIQQTQPVVAGPFDYMQPGYQTPLDIEAAETDLEGVNMTEISRPTDTISTGAPDFITGEIDEPFGADVDIEQGFVGSVEESDKETVEQIADIADRQPEVIEEKKNELADIYDRQVESGQRQEDPTTTSKTNKAKAVINMPQMLGDVGGGRDQPAPSRPGGAPATGPHGGGGDTGGGGKIVCTMMNESYGFGSFRNKIWLRHSKDLAPEYQIGYHKIFLPLVKLSKKNIVLKKVLEHIAIHRTIDIRQEARGKRHLLGRIYRRILEPLCYWVGKNAKR